MANPRFDRSPPERDPTRNNERIRVSEVRLIDEDGAQVGIVPTEQAHPERGRALLQRLYDDIEDLATIEQEPEQEGRNMSMLLAPVRAKGGDAERSAAA